MILQGYEQIKYLDQLFTDSPSNGFTNSVSYKYSFGCSKCDLVIYLDECLLFFCS